MGATPPEQGGISCSPEESFATAATARNQLPSSVIPCLWYLQTPAPLILVASCGVFDIVIALLSSFQMGSARQRPRPQTCEEHLPL
jgi:hypothetical protein